MPPIQPPPCPVCGTPPAGTVDAACPVCGLPAAGRAGVVLARIGATLAELSRDRDDLLTALRAAAPGAPGSATPGNATPGSATPGNATPGNPGRPAPSPPWAPPAGWVPPVAWAPPTVPPVPVGTPRSFPPPSAPAAPPAPVPAGPPRAPRLPRLSPQQVLLGLGALLVVAAALAFVAVAWTRLGVAFQSLVMLAVTGAAVTASAYAARRSLRATEEALAAAGAALLVVDLGAAHALGLLGVDQLPLRVWTALSAAVVAATALGLRRLTPTTTSWPLVALLAAQPVPVLLLPPGTLAGPVGVAVVLVLAAADLVAAPRLRPGVRRVAEVLAPVWAVVGVLGGLALAAGGDAVESWTATAVLAAAGVAAGTLARAPMLAPRLPGGPVLAGTAAGTTGLALAGSLQTLGAPGPVVAGALGVAALTGAAAVLTSSRATGTGLLAAGTALALVGAGVLADAERLRPLALLALAVALPAATAAVRVPAVRGWATAVTALAPVAAVLLAREDRWLTAAAAGLLLALTGAAGFAVGAWRAGHREEWAGPAAGSIAGLAAAATGSDAGAWGQVGLQLTVVGVAAGCYALVSGRRWVGAAAVADLVVACWVAMGGAGVLTPEAYTLPAAAGLLLVALPRLRAGARSWAAEGAAVGVALVPSAFVVVADPSAVRLVLVVAAAAVLTAGGAVRHRQAPFVLGAASLGFVVLGRLGPYAPLLPRWVVLAAAGLLLLAVGASYERRRQQAREAVAWVAQMG